MRAYGWTSTNEIIEDEAEELRRMAQHVADGGALRPLVSDLADRGVLSATGRPWAGPTIKRALVNPRMIGKTRSPSGRLVNNPDVPPILTPEVYKKVTAILEDPDRKRFAPKGGEATHLLAGGVARCGLCNSELFHTTAAPGRPAVYGCATRSGGCGKIAIQANIIEPPVELGVLKRLADGPWRAKLADTIRASPSVVQDRIDELKKRQTALGSDYASLAITRSQLQAANAQFKEEIARAELEKRAAELADDLPEPNARDVAKWWDEAPVARRRDVVATVLDHVTVMPRQGREKRSDPKHERLQFFWR